MADQATFDFDPVDKVLRIRRENDAGAHVPGDGSLELRFGTNPAAPYDGMADQDLKCWRLHYVDSETGTPKRVRAVFSAPEDDDPESDVGNTDSDIWIGGGAGGGTRRFRVHADNGDYLTCRTWGDIKVTAIAINNHGTSGPYAPGNVLTVVGGTLRTGASAAKITVDTVDGGGLITGATLTNGGGYLVGPGTSGVAVTGGGGSGATFDLTLSGGEGGADVLVAKLPELRTSLTAENNVDGSNLTYSYPARASVIGGVQRNSTDGTSTIIEIVVPVWHNNESGYYTEIWADQPTGGTGVYVDGVEVTWLVRDCRFWARIPA